LLDADSLPFGMVVFDRTGNAVGINQAWATMTGQTALRAAADGWLDAVVESDRRVAEAHVRAALAGSDTGVVDWRLQPSRERQRWMRARIEVDRDADGAIGGCVVFLADSDDEHDREQHLEYQATHDGLTGVLNRAHFVEQARRALARLGRHPGTLALVFVDLDGFKDVNDRHGHVFGDSVLTAQAQRFQHAVRPNDIVARYGGDEFVVLCEDLGSSQEARSVADRIVSDLQRPHDMGTVSIELHASVGVVTTNDPYADLTTLLERADLAMYRAKERGRDCVECETMMRELDSADPVIDLDVERQRDWQNVLMRIHQQLRDTEAALGRLWADEVSHQEAETAHRLADAARYVSRAVRSLSDDVIA
jgi:diguanylate cyclase (GGDEF)-like protein/PAS domain S-box-containing protein